MAVFDFPSVSVSLPILFFIHFFSLFPLFQFISTHLFPYLSLFLLFLWLLLILFNQADSTTRCFLLPQWSYVVFPSRKVLILNILMAINMYVGRLPAIYYAYNKLNSNNEMLVGWLSYDNVLLIVSFSVLPIAFAAMYWSVSFMLFRREFTACPGK